MAQEFVNRFRRQRRLVSLDEESEDGAQFAATDSVPTAVVDPRVEAATDEVLSRLGAEDRFILASYYLDGRTLAEIARMLALHESTISRKLDKLTKAVRKQIVAALERKGMNRRQAAEALEVDVRDLQVNIRDRLAQETAPQAFSDKKGEVRTPDVDPGRQGGLRRRELRSPVSVNHWRDAGRRCCEAECFEPAGRRDPATQAAKRRENAARGVRPG